MTDLRISGATTNARSESDIRLNYGDPSRVIAASNDLNATTQPQFFSTDGGATWGSTNLPAVAGDSFQSDPEVDWTSDGTAWALTLGVDAATNSRLYSYRSTDNGATWTFESVVSAAQTAADREIVWVDHSPTSQFKDQVYSVWHNGTPVFVSRRTAGAAGTWSAPLQVSGTETTVLGIGADVRTNADGDVFVFWPDADGSQSIVFVRSVDGGTTFSAPQVIATTFANTRRLAIPAGSSRRLRVYVSAGAYRSATRNMVYAVWTDLSGGTGCTTGGGPGSTTTSNCKTRVWFVRSTDGGTTWSAPAMINNQTGRNDQFHSRLCVDETNGLIVVTYRDTVADTGRLQSHVYYQTSSDDGVSWSNAVQVTTTASDATGTAVDSNGFGYGDYDGLSGNAGTFFPCWTDFRNGVEEIWSSRLSVIPKQASFAMDRSSFGQDEVNAMLAIANPFAVSPAFYFIVDGFTPAELGITAGDLVGAPATVPALTHAPATSGITFGAPTQLVADNPALPAGVTQRFTWLYPISVSSEADFAAPLVNIVLAASISGVTANAILELRQEPNPYELDGQTSWLSTDLRVFQVKDGDPRFGATLTGGTLSAASSFITQVIANLNGGSTGGQTFDALSTTNGDVALYQTDSAGKAVFTFAVARVRYQALVDDATAVRVFFRLLPALTVSLAFDPTTTCRTFSDGVLGGHKVPLLGRVNNNILSIPCFAAERVASASASMNTQTDPANVRTLVHNPSGAEVDSYFGCILDVNQSAQAVFPLHPSNDGPFGGSLQSVLSLVRNAHQCLTAEITFDPDPITTGSTPASSDKLAQRNLSLVASDNPGAVTSRRIPNTFEVRPTPAGHAAAGFHDELMIDWSNVPAGSVARVYLPDTAPDQVLDLAKLLYRAGRLQRIDDHTLECRAEGITYLPVPAGAQVNHAGLLTIDLPPGVKHGQSFHAVVRQLTHTGRVIRKPSGAGPLDVRDAALMSTASTGPATGSRLIVWEHVLGAFQVTIPISNRALLIDDEMRLLSVLRWILTSVPTTDRWYLPFRRYVHEIGERVGGFGGDPGTVKPDPNGFPGGLPPGAAEPGGGGIPVGAGWRTLTGKVSSILYDRYGDFEGFTLDSADGEHLFRSREHTIEDLAVRAWRERTLVMVSAHARNPHRPETIVLRHGPRPHWG